MPLNRKISWLIAAVAAVTFMPFLGRVALFDWDEVNFAECAREMIALGDYLRVHIDYLPFWEKPPLFFWLQAICMHLFGVGEYAARFPNAVCGVLTLVLLFHVGASLHHWRFGLLWAGAYFGSILPHFYFRSGIIDPWFNLLIFLGFYFFILSHWRKNNFTGVNLNYPAPIYLTIGGLCLSLALLAKGPAALIITGLCLMVYWVRERFGWYVPVSYFIIYGLLSLSAILIWYGIETLQNGPQLAIEFTKYQYRLFTTPDAGHEGFIGYHFVVLLIGCFPASIFAIKAMTTLRNRHERTAPADFQRWMTILFWVVLILFSIVKTKIVHYSSMAYFPLTYLAASAIEEILQRKTVVNSWMQVGLVAISSLWAVVLMVVPSLAQHAEVLKPLLANDPFAQANLEAHVHWYGWEAITGIIFLVGTMGGVRALKKFPLHGVIALFAATALMVTLTVYLYVPKIIQYTQGASVEFFRQLEGKDCYVYTYGYRSYVHWFYAKTKPDTRPITEDGLAWQNYLFYGPVKKNVYVACKIFSRPELDTVSTLQFLYEQNGFAFYKRRKPSSDLNSWMCK
ncbi:MAG: glycosyltransferase family 39 protein [Cytophagales bacterium]|nr:glycosyltransferase family 39 protein [Bernardetiaceae bacterium]MDW8210716.1 glycosyltransferase family 39 protein [Cytophagales bacterium]